MNNKSLSSAFLTAILIYGLILVSATRFGTVQASLPRLPVPSQPSVPYFTLKLGAYVKDFPPTYSVNPYTGENVTQSAGAQVEIKYINLIITNQQVTPFQESNGNDINLYYEVRVKGNFEDRWTELPRTTATDSAYTELRYDLGQFGSYPIFQGVPVGGKLDFQVQALLGYYTTVYQTLLPIGEDFHGETSGWSNTQTVIIGESQTPTPSPATTPTPTTPTPSQEPPQTEQIEPILGAAIVVAVIIAVLGLLIYLTKRK